MTLGLKFLLWKNIDFWFKKNSIQTTICNWNKCILVCKGACIKVQYKHYNEKKKQTRGRGSVKDTEFSVNTIRTLWVELLALPSSSK